MYANLQGSERDQSFSIIIVRLVKNAAPQGIPLCRQKHLACKILDEAEGNVTVIEMVYLCHPQTESLFQLYNRHYNKQLSYNMSQRSLATKSSTCREIASTVASA